MRAEDLGSCAETLQRSLPGLILHTRTPGALECATALGLGLHISESSDWAECRREFTGVLGASVHSRDGLLQAQLAGLDYALLSPVFPPTSKPQDGRTPLGLEGLRSALQGLDLPVYALGGIQSGDVAGCLAAGACGVAVLGGLFQDPRGLAQAAQDYLSSLSGTYHSPA
jgi:thiamine-phosphate pyrophosphorylase